MSASSVRSAGDRRTLVYCDSGRGGAGIAVEPPTELTCQGTVEIPASQIKWKIPQISEGLASPAIAENRLFRTHNPCVLKAFDLANGKELYAKRLDALATAASPIITLDGLLYFASAGKSYIIRAGDQFDQVSVNDLGDPSAASPAVARGKLILKGEQYLFCIGKKAEK